MELALNNNTRIELAANEISQIWSKKYENREEAFGSLVSSLKDCGMNQIAASLFQNQD